MEFKGESMVSVRLQKKIVTYEYSAKLYFSVDVADGKDNTVDGEYVLPEISNDILADGEQWEISARIV